MAVEPGTRNVITGISSMAMRNVLAELGDAYEQQSGQPVSVVSVGGVDAARRVNDGEAFDFVVLAADVIEQLAAAGRIDAGSRTDLARSAVAIAVAAAATRPDVSTESAIRDAVLRARSIGYSSGPSGAHLVRLFERWGNCRRHCAAHRASFARRSRGHARGTRRCRARLPAVERIDALAGYRSHRPAASGDPGGNRVLGGGMHRIELSRGREGVALLSRFTGSRCGEASPWYGASMNRR